MNIMEIVSNRGMNGAVHHCLLLTRELRRRGHRVTLVCDGESWISKQVAGEDIDMVASDLHRWPTDELRRITAIAHQKQIDVVHTHMSRANFFGVLLRWFAGIPSVATAHSSHFQPHWMFNDFVIACSDAMRHYHHTHNLVRSSRIETVRTFIDCHNLMEVSDEIRAKVRAVFGIEESSHLIGILGSVLPRKGTYYLVRALPQILEAMSDTHLLIVGHSVADDYAAKIKSVAKELGIESKIVWTGFRDDVNEIRAALDVCVMPSLMEPLGMSILESMAIGVPVVATNVGGIPECIGTSGAGTLVPAADSNALAESIIPLLREPARQRKFSDAGQRRVMKHFSPESQVPRIEACFARVAMKTARRKAA